MRIIKEGKIKELPKEIEMTCKHCDCVFAYEQDDVHYGMTLYPDCRSINYVICPFCENKIEIEKPRPI